MKYNFDEYEKTLKNLFKIKAEIRESNHDSADSEGYYPSDIELDVWHDSLKLPKPYEAINHQVIELPDEYWTNIFYENHDGENTLSEEEYEEVLNSSVYKLLFKTYSNVYEEMYTAVAEESAYYERECSEMERHFDSLRGAI